MFKVSVSLCSCVWQKVPGKGAHRRVTGQASQAAYQSLTESHHFGLQSLLPAQPGSQLQCTVLWFASLYYIEVFLRLGKKEEKWITFRNSLQIPPSPPPPQTNKQSNKKTMPLLLPCPFLHYLRNKNNKLSCEFLPGYFQGTVVMCHTLCKLNIYMTACIIWHS